MIDPAVFSAASVAPTVTKASAMFFGTVLFATVTLATRAYLTGDGRLFEAAANPRSSALDIKSLTSLYTLLYHTSIFGFILFYAYIAEYHPPFPHADKNYDADIFFFLTFLLFVVSAYTWKRHDNGNKKISKSKESGDLSLEDTPPPSNGSVRAVADANAKTEILNRDQTEEWKGWMQFMFLLYHYYHAEEVYNAIRIMITCYVWMTGFGNFSFFYLKADYGAVRVLQMLWRLNFLVLFLCLTQGTTYILYYICLLHTYFFLMVYVVMKIGSSHNYSKWWVRIKMAVLALIIFVVWDCDSGVFNVIHYPFFGTDSKMGAGAGSMWEWYFRSSLDHWSTFLGMVFALNFPITSLFYRKLEAQPLLTHVLAKGLVGIALLVAFYFWVTGPFMQGKVEYNATNAYYGFIPLITYIYFRNLTPWLRNHTLELLHQIGKTTLETYLMQHHIWLTSNAKSLLTLVPGWPKVNFLLVSLIYVLLSRRLYQLTLFLRGMVLPDNKNACLKNLFGMFVVLASFCLLGFMLEEQQVLGLQAIGVVSVACGYVLYQLVIAFTTPAGGKAPEAARAGGNPVGATASYLVAVCIVLFFGLSWHSMAIKGATQIQLLPPRCDTYVNKGEWVALNGCDEGSRGQGYRSFGVSPEGTCSAQNPVYVWDWQEPPSASHCRFKQRDPKSLKKHLRKRSISFIGDSTTRYLFHSFSRQLGIKDAGAYNVTAGKHLNFYETVGDINLEFVWAPYADEVLDAIKEVKTLPLFPPNAGDKKRPDLVMLGGGAWDKLWHYNTDQEKSALRTAVGEIATQMQQLRDLGVPVVWLTPTTINTPALPSDEKQERINEEEMENLRSLYQSQGVLSSASFVIDGPSFTESRVAESFDGVHYPHQVYSAGAQIFCNSLDWLLHTPVPVDPPPPPRPGKMAQPKLGLMMFCFIFFGIVCFDGFMGFSYLAALVVPAVSPMSLYYEAFSTLHRIANLPALEIELAAKTVVASPPSSDNFDVEEVASLIDKEH
mmetsp:Transcript_118197/g.176627  ORF Transcript_118197/g.176627 Transcript_118197/m.176627 type:complete len:1001 (-) Transcript_118197:34-3036(-)